MKVVKTILACLGVTLFLAFVTFCVGAVYDGYQRDLIITNPGVVSKYQEKLNPKDYRIKVEKLAQQVVGKVEEISLKKKFFVKYEGLLGLGSGTYLYAELTNAENQQIQAFVRKLNSMVGLKSILVGTTENHTYIDMYDRTFCRLHVRTYAFFYNTADYKVTPAMPRGGYKYAMIQSDISPSFYTKNPLPYGKYRFYALQFYNDSDEINKIDKAYAKCYNLELTEDKDELSAFNKNEAGWGFGKELPFHVGQVVYTSSRSADINMKPGTIGKVLAVHGAILTVKFPKSIEDLNYAWFTDQR